jgi:metal-dependent amidase/aminoacylase/carboxypeptidase family protein
MKDIRRINTNSDLDLVMRGELEIEKYCATRNVTPRTAYVWCLERAKSDEEREKIKGQMKDYFATGTGLM